MVHYRGQEGELLEEALSQPRAALTGHLEEVRDDLIEEGHTADTETLEDQPSVGVQT